MIKIKSKYNFDTNNALIKYDSKHTCTLENLFVINHICNLILENQEDMTINKIFAEVKKIRKEIEENGK